jgi:hypothetical protein
MYELKNARERRITWLKKKKVAGWKERLYLRGSPFSV